MPIDYTAVEAVGHSSWIRPSSVQEMARETDVIAYGRVTGVRPGPPIGAVPPRPDEGTLPTERVTFERLAVLRGSAPEVYTVTHLGSPTYVDIDDPSYVPGERYILFLRKHPTEEDTFDRVAIDGRLREVANGRFHAVFNDHAGGELHGRTREEIERKVR
jgi:hypothetical protein